MAVHQAFPAIHDAQALAYFDASHLTPERPAFAPTVKQVRRPNMLVLVLAAVALVDVALLLAVVHFLGGDSTLAQSVTGAAAAIGALIFKPGFAYLAALASRKPALIGGSLLLGAMTASAIIAALVALVLLVAGLSRVAGGGSSGRLFA